MLIDATFLQGAAQTEPSEESEARGSDAVLSSFPRAFASGPFSMAKGMAVKHTAYIRTEASKARADLSHSSDRMVIWTHSGLPFIRSLA